LVQTLVQLPQCDAEVERSVSQPSTTFALQSSKPDLQVTRQRPLSHDGLALVELQTVPQPPQFCTS
jgi:hypothetical protein